MAITEKYASSAGAGSKDGSSESNAWDWATMLTAAAAGDRVNFKGSHTLSGNAVFSNTGSQTAPIVLRGYASTITDGYQGRDSNGFLVTTNFGVLASSAYNITMPNYSIIECMDVTSNKNDAAIITSTGGVAVRCKAVNSGTGAGSRGIIVVSYGLCYDCDAYLTGASGGSAALYGTAGNFVACFADGGVASALQTASANAIHCVLFSSGIYGVYVSNANDNILLAYNTIVSNSSNGIHLVTGPTRLLITIDNLIRDNTGYGINAVDAASAIFSANNRLYNNTGGESSGAADWLAATGYGNNTTACTQANEFPGYASNDYRLGPTSPARQNGIPAYMDIGALQRVEDYPAASNVLTSDTVDGSAGTFDEAARNTDPGEAHVEDGVTYKIQNASKTGTYSAGGSGVFMPRPHAIGV